MDEINRSHVEDCVEQIRHHNDGVFDDQEGRNWAGSDEYFETNPVENSFAYEDTHEKIFGQYAIDMMQGDDHTNRELQPIKKFSLDEELGLEAGLQDGQTVKFADSETLERYVQEAIRLQAEVTWLRGQLIRVNWILRLAARLKCSKRDLENWSDIRRYTKERWTKLAIAIGVFALVILIISLMG